MADEQVASAQEEPKKGGSYTRNPDGTLTRMEGPEDPEEQPQE